jgi:hypothetical protein
VPETVRQVGAEVATIPTPRLHLAKVGTGWCRRLASRITIEAAQMSPSTVIGTSRAVGPDSPCETTNSYGSAGRSRRPAICPPHACGGSLSSAGEASVGGYGRAN